MKRNRTSSRFNYPDYAILVATRNRPEHLKRLLNSISSLKLKPREVIVVASGNSVSNIISESKDLTVKYVFTVDAGQVHQKTIGIEKIGPDVQWVLFVNDDITLCADSICHLFEALSSRNLNIVGLGLRELNTNTKKRRHFYKRTRRLGTVTKFGSNISYMSIPKISYSSWLNGASMWRKDLLSLYHFPYSASKHAMCEDLIFSFRSGKLGKLLFVPNATYYSQYVDDEFQFQADRVISRFISDHYWRIFFIKENPEFSIYLFFIKQFARLSKLLIVLAWSNTLAKQHFERTLRVYFSSLKYLKAKQVSQTDFEITRS